MAGGFGVSDRVTRHRYRFPNGRIGVLHRLDGQDLCPVCGSLVYSAFELPSGPADADGVISVEGPSDVGYSYNICGVCGVEYGFDCFFHGDDLDDDGQERGWREERARFLRRIGRTPDLFDLLDRIGAEPAGGFDPIPDDVAARDWDGWTALTWAAATGDAGRAGELLRRGAEPDARTSRGETPLMWAARRGSQAIVGILIAAGADVNARTTAGRVEPDLPWAGEGEALPRRPAGETVLFWAAEKGHADVAARLIAAGADAAAADAVGRTALSVASNAAVVALLVNAGADANRGDARGHAPLHYAVRARNVEVVQALVAAGADVNAASPGKDGDTPLLVACTTNNVSMARVLAELGADVNKPAGKVAPLHEAACLAGPEMVRLLVEAGADVNRRGYRGEPPLRAAIYRFGPKVENARVLLEAGADPTIAMVAGETPLHVAAGHGSVELVRMMLRPGVDVNARDKNGRTPLHEAVTMGGGVLVVKELLLAGARADIADRSGKTPLDYVARPRTPPDVRELVETAARGEIEP